MPFTLFHSKFPEIAAHETRTISIFSESDFNLPPGDYGFLEMFCDEAGCDCRRVFFHVVSASQMKLEAVITWGWERRSFYVKWMREKDSKMIDFLVGPSLSTASPQTQLAPELLKLVRLVLLQRIGKYKKLRKKRRIFMCLK